MKLIIRFKIIQSTYELCTYVFKRIRNKIKTLHIIPDKQYFHLILKEFLNQQQQQDDGL